MKEFLLYLGIGFVIGWFLPLRRIWMWILHRRGALAEKQREELYQELRVLLTDAYVILGDVNAYAVIGDIKTFDLLNLGSLGEVWCSKYKDLIRRMIDAGMIQRVIMSTPFGKFGGLSPKTMRGQKVSQDKIIV
jgi:hypothetical protein